MPRPACHLAVLATLLCLAIWTSACGGGEDDATLAIDSIAWSGPNALVLTTECATDVSATVGIDAGGSEVPQISVTGDPQVGRCSPTATVTVPAGTTKVIDAATSQVIDLPPTP